MLGILYIGEVSFHDKRDTQHEGKCPMRSRSSTQQTIQISVNVPSWIATAIDAVAKRDFASRSQVVTRVLMNAARDFAPENADIPDPVDFSTVKVD